MMTGGRLFRDAGDHDFDGDPLPLRPKRCSIVLLEDEGAAGVKGVGAEDSLVRLTRNGAGLATFAVDEADDGSARPCWAGRTGRAGGSGWAGLALFARRGDLLLFASGKRQGRQQQANDEPANLHQPLSISGGYRIRKRRM